MRLGIVADDLTGATTTGALLAHSGDRPTVLFEQTELSSHVAGAGETIILTTGSRAMEAEVAFWRVHRATQSLRAAGVELFSKRIDTTCRGNIGPEVEGMLTALGEDRVAVIVPAMSASRRIVVDGYSLIDSQLLAETDAAKDVRTPVTESHLPTLLRRQFSRSIEHVALATVLAGPAAIAARLTAARAEGAAVFLVDAVSEQQVADIAHAVMSLRWRIVAVDPGPFTQHLAVEHGIVAEARRTAVAGGPGAIPSASGVVAVIAGSATAMTHQQMTRLAEEPGTRVFAADVLALVSTGDDYEREASRVVEELARSLAAVERPRIALLALDTVISGIRSSRADLEERSGLQGQAISALLLRHFADLARRFLDEIGAARLAGLYLTGGDVMASICAALEATGLRMTDYVIPQVDLAEIVGGPFEGVRTVCKGGLTGDRSTAIHAIARMLDESTRKVTDNAHQFS